jgi:hypothetical protein
MMCINPSFIGRQIASDPESIKDAVREITLIALPNGIEFETKSLKASSITEGAAYPGGRIELDDLMLNLNVLSCLTTNQKSTLVAGPMPKNT